MKIAIVVDAYSSGSLLAPELLSRGYRVLHVQSSAEIPKGFQSSFHPSDFFLNIPFTRNVPTLVAMLRRFQPDAVFAGAESGVRLADRLSADLGLAGNDPTSSEARRNKYLMIETVRKAGLLATKQVVSAQLSEILSWAKTETPFPIVVKPLESAGTDGVFICHSLDQVKLAFTEIHTKVNQLGLRNEAVLAQAFLHGAEFIVDTVSSGGRHVVTDVWEYEKQTVNGRERVYDRILLRDSYADQHRGMVEYFYKVLDALGIQEGPAHGEIILTPQGPVLVEVGARCAGVHLPKLVKACGGYDQVTATIDAAIRPEHFKKVSSVRKPAGLHGQAIFLVSHHDGLLQRPLLLQAIERLPSYVFSKVSATVGTRLQPTVDCFSTPGLVYLADADPDTIERDYRRLRHLETSGLYEWSLTA